MAEVEWTDNALRQVSQIVAYIDPFDSDAAQRLGDRLMRAGNSLSDFPRRGRPAGRAMCELVTVPPYVLRYVVIGDVVTILSIRHGRRRPPA